jgi:NAD(P)-dependent dehydrogenase (short-subunit alcohol dehydrogenase family)
MLLKDKVAIVSGIGPGMGRDISLAFAREGANLVLAARTASALESLADEIRKLGRKAIPVATDIAKPEDCDQLAATAVRELGRIDVLVNNAFRGPSFRNIEDDNVADWRAIFDVNVIGSIQLSKAVVPQMKKQGGGSIVMVNSMSMRIVEPGHGGYAASKGALMVATQTLAKEVGPYKIRVNSVVPGYIWSEKLEGYFKILGQQQGTSGEAVYKDIASRTCLQHIPDSAEIADTVVFFASDLSRVVSGQALDVNAGHFMH